MTAKRLAELPEDRVKEDVPGTCAKQCTVTLDGKESITVYEGWTGPDEVMPEALVQGR